MDLLRSQEATERNVSPLAKAEEGLPGPEKVLEREPVTSQAARRICRTSKAVIGGATTSLIKAGCSAGVVSIKARGSAEVVSIKARCSAEIVRIKACWSEFLATGGGRVIASTAASTIVTCTTTTRRASGRTVPHQRSQLSQETTLAPEMRRVPGKYG